MGMYQSYEKPPSRYRIVRRVLLGAAVAVGIYVFSFAAFVVRGHYETGIAGWEFNYLGRGASASPGKEDLLHKAYRPLYSLSRALGVPIVYLGRDL
jgi:hypothetical protein